MRENPTSQSGVFNPQTLAAFALCWCGFLLGMFSLTAAPVLPGVGGAVIVSDAASEWSIVNSPNPPPSPIPNNILGSTCVAASDCWAVGYSNDGSPDRTLILHWDG